LDLEIAVLRKGKALARGQRRVVRSPMTRADLPLTSSMGSGFFFWGMMLLPVETQSAGVMNPNSSVAHRTHSSASREVWIAMMLFADRSSMRKSRSDTPSTLQERQNNTVQGSG